METSARSSPLAGWRGKEDRERHERRQRGSTPPRAGSEPPPVAGVLPAKDRDPLSSNGGKVVSALHSAHRRLNGERPGVG